MSLVNLREEFRDREEDMDEIISIMSEINIKKEALNYATSLAEFNILDRRVNILKSSLHLIAYNQVENVARGCIESIYDHIKDNGVTYGVLKEKIQIKILHRCVKDNENGNILFRKIGRDISDKIIQASLNVRKEFNGNVSKDIINKIANAYGINIINAPECRNGIDLDTLKDIRNELAHGSIGFSRKGQNDSVDEVIRRVKHINQYLLLLIGCTEEYITQNGYLSAQYAL